MQNEEYDNGYRDGYKAALNDVGETLADLYDELLVEGKASGAAFVKGLAGRLSGELGPGLAEGAQRCGLALY